MVANTKIAKLVSKQNMLGPEAVADAVVQQLHTGMGAQLLMPWHLGLTTGIRGFPSWLQEWLRDLSRF